MRCGKPANSLSLVSSIGRKRPRCDERAPSLPSQPTVFLQTPTPALYKSIDGPIDRTGYDWCKLLATYRRDGWMDAATPLHQPPPLLDTHTSKWSTLLRGHVLLKQASMWLVAGDSFSCLWNSVVWKVDTNVASKYACMRDYDYLRQPSITRDTLRILETPYESHWSRLNWIRMIWFGMD